MCVLGSAPARLLLRIALRDRDAGSLARVDGVGAGVVLDGAGTLLGGRLVDKGGAVDREGAGRVAGLGDGGGSSTSEGSTGVGVGATIVASGVGIGTVVAAIVTSSVGVTTVVASGVAAFALALTTAALTGTVASGVGVATSVGIAAVASGTGISTVVTSGTGVTTVVASGIGTIASGTSVGTSVVATGTGISTTVVASGVTTSVTAGVGAVASGTGVGTTIVASRVSAGVTTSVSAGVSAGVATGVATGVGAVALTNSEADAVLLRPTLGDRHQDGLMVGSAGHGAQAVVALGKTTRDIGAELARTVSGVVDALEEDELLGIQGLGGVEVVAEVLDRDVGVTRDLAVGHLLRARVVRVDGVGEGAEVHVGNKDLDAEGLALCEIIHVLGVEDNGRHHVVDRRDVAHDCIAVSTGR